jgi:DNA polymerase lambda
LELIYELSGDKFRALAYSKAIEVLKSFTEKITDISQVQHIPTIGKNLQGHIREILETGTVKKLQHLEENPLLPSIIELTQVWGIGDKKALKLIQQGYKSVKDLQDHLDYPNLPLTTQQRISIKYYDELKQEIPRDEIEEIASIVRNHTSKLLKQGFDSFICGAYRRGKASSNDIDILIIPKPDQDGDESYPSNTLLHLINSLADERIITDHLIHPSHGHIHQHPRFDPFASDNCQQHSSSSSKAYEGKGEGYKIHEKSLYMGICRLPDGSNHIHRRLDIKVSTSCILYLL